MASRSGFRKHSSGATITQVCVAIAGLGLVAVVIYSLAGRSTDTGIKDVAGASSDEGTGPAGSSVRTLAVRGTLYLAVRTQLGVDESIKQIDLPETAVWLRSTSGSDGPVAKTSLNGAFIAVAPTRGAYKICWSIPGTTGCSTEVDIASPGETYVGRVAAIPDKRVVFGKVLTGDGRPCWAQDGFFGLDFKTRLTAARRIQDIVAPPSPASTVSTGSSETHAGADVGVTGAPPTEVAPTSAAGSETAGTPVVANSRGEYAFTDLSTGVYVITASCEKAQKTQRVVTAVTAMQVDMTLPNHAPTLEPLSAFDGSMGTLRAAPASNLRVEANVRDAENQTVSLRWRTASPVNALSSLSPVSQMWRISTSERRNSLYVMASDGYGGYAYRKLDVKAATGDLSFSGRVLDETSGAPVPNATVSIGQGGSTTTNAQGWFTVSAQPAADRRYVVNVHHPDFALASRVFDDGTVGATFEMIRADVKKHDPAAAISIVDATGSGWCGGGRPIRRLVDVIPYIDRSRPTTVSPAYLTALVERLRTAVARESDCNRRGASVDIPAGALVREDGVAIVGKVTTSLSTYNPGRRALPGDYGGVTASNGAVELLSFGAANLELRDDSGGKLNLKPGTQATISIPVPDAQRPMATPTIAMWSYDERSGKWREEGRAALQNTSAGWVYVGKTSHFSSINMDLEDGSAVCVRYAFDDSFNAWSDISMRAYVSYKGNQLKVKETEVNESDRFHAIFKLPHEPGAFPPNTVRLEVRGRVDDQPVVLLDTS